VCSHGEVDGCHDGVRGDRQRHLGMMGRGLLAGPAAQTWWEAGKASAFRGLPKPVNSLCRSGPACPANKSGATMRPDKMRHT
jgi:hypothetical protein